MNSQDHPFSAASYFTQVTSPFLDNMTPGDVTKNMLKIAVKGRDTRHDAWKCSLLKVKH